MVTGSPSFRGNLYSDSDNHPHGLTLFSVLCENEFSFPSNVPDTDINGYIIEQRFEVARR